MSQDSGVIKEGWLYREEVVSGSISTWKKRWNVLTLQKLCCYKHDKATEPISSVSVASVEEMAYGNIADKSYAFSLTTPRGIVKLAAESEEIRESWVSTLRALVPKAKVELAKEMLMRKAKRKANLELAQQQIKEAIESILRDSKRVAVRGGFKTYADALADCFQQLLVAVDHVSELGLNSAKQCAYAISSIVDAANSAAAICSNKAIQDEIVVRTRDIAVETANLLGYATTASHDQIAQQKMYECIESIQDQVQQILELLAAAGKLQQELDDSKAAIEQALQMSQNDRNRGDLNEGQSLEANIDALTDKAKVLSSQIKNIATNATVQPERVGEYSKEAAELMCELLDATSIIAVQSGMDPDDPHGYSAEAGSISEHKRQQLETLLAAAKGFAAATTNMVDLLGQIPQQEDDENLQFRLSMATRSADNALNAFLISTQNVDTTEQPMQAQRGGGVAGAGAYAAGGGGPDYGEYESAATLAEMDAEAELLAALQAIEASVSRLDPVADSSAGSRPGAIVDFQSGRVYEMTDAEYDQYKSSGVEASIVQAAQQMGRATANLVNSAVVAQKDMVSTEGEDFYRKDPTWTGGLVGSAQSVAETTNQLVEVAMDPNTTPEDIVAAARCVNGATARLIAFTRAKGDPNSPGQKKMDNAAKSISQATNALVNAAKAAKQRQLDEAVAQDVDALREAPRTRQIKEEFEAQARIAKLEAELDGARQYLFKLRRAVYGGDVGAGDAVSSTRVAKKQSLITNTRAVGAPTAAARGRGGPARGRGGPTNGPGPRGRGRAGPARGRGGAPGSPMRGRGRGGPGGVSPVRRGGGVGGQPVPVRNAPGRPDRL